MLGALQDECRGSLRTLPVWRALSGGTKPVPTRTGHSQPNWCDSGTTVLVLQVYTAQGTRVGGLEGGLVAKERLLVFGQLAGQHDSTKLFKEKRNSDFAKSVLSRTP